jgi:hypothetical protein
VPFYNFLNSIVYSEPKDMPATPPLFPCSQMPYMPNIALPALPMVDYLQNMTGAPDNHIDFPRHIQGNTYPNLAPRPSLASPVDRILPRRSSCNMSCGRCGNRLSNARNRRRHEEYSCIELRQKKVIPCTFGNCDQRFCRPDGLIKHMTQVHKACTICSAVFEKKSEVTDHKRMIHRIPKRTSSGSEVPIAR